MKFVEFLNEGQMINGDWITDYYDDNFDIKYSEAFNGHIFTNQFDDFIEASNGFNEELHQIDGYTEELPEFVY